MVYPVVLRYSNVVNTMSVLKKIFVPSGKKFYDLFDKITENLSTLSTTFEEFITTTDRYKRKSLLDKSESLKQRCDDHTHRLLAELSRNYITPFDREDIHFMASALDHISDYIMITTKQMYHFDIDKHLDDTMQIAQSVTKYVGLLSETMKGLRNQRELKALIDTLADMREIMSESGDMITHFQTTTLNESNSTVDLIKLHDHFDVLSSLNEKCVDVISVLEVIVIKYG